MITSILAQLDELTAFQRAVRKELQEGWSLTSTVLAIGFLVAIVVVTYFLLRRQERERRGHAPRRPAKLFHDLLDQMSLGSDEKRLLQGITQRNRLANPSVLLLSPKLFDQHAERYLAQRPVNGPKTVQAVELEVIARVRRELFPGN